MWVEETAKWHCLLALLAALCVTEVHSYEYCIVGAGPGGLQMGQYLFNRKRDYVTFEKAATAGSFFDKYPSHRQLISLNKRFTGRNSEEFNLRHDWNSLLDGDPKVPPMTNRSEEYYPHASVLAEYLRDFSVLQAAHIRYSTAVTKVSKKDGGFEIEANGPKGPEMAQCKIVMMAQGLGVPNKPKIIGLEENAIGYEDLWQEKYSVKNAGGMWREKNIAILGTGNGALETADAVGPHANMVHIFPRTDGSPRFSWETHYVGSIRAIRMHHFDRYLLKSIDVLDLPATYQSEADRLMIQDCTLPTDDGAKKCFFKLSATMVKGERVNGSVVQLGWYNASDPVQQELQEELGPKFRIQPEQSLYNGKYEWTIEWIMVMTEDFLARLDLMPQFRHVLETAWRGNLVRKPYDYVVRCQGWHQNTNVYDKSSKPRMLPNLKYAEMNSKFESVNVPGLFFVGTLGHGKDYRKASGGFIHGFRYTARALDRIFEVERHGGVWPKLRSFPVQLGKAFAMTHEILSRIDRADGSYQMFTQLGDGLIFCRAWDGDEGLRAVYLEELPTEYFHEIFYNTPRIWWEFRYHKDYNPFIYVAERGTTFMPHLYLYGASKDKPKVGKEGRLVLPKHKADHVIPEDQHTEFSHGNDAKFLQMWIEEHLQRIQEREAKGTAYTRCSDYGLIGKSFTSERAEL